MEVAATLPDILRACPLRIMATEDFHSSQHVVFSSVHGKAAVTHADEGIEERGMDMRKDALQPASCCREEQQYSYGNGPGPSLAYHLSYSCPNPNLNARLYICEDSPASASSSAAPRSPPLSVVTNNMRLERSADALLSLPDKFAHGNQCQASSPAEKPRAFSPLKQAQIFSLSSSGHRAAPSLLQASLPVKLFQASSQPIQSQAFLSPKQPSPSEEPQAPPLEETRAPSPAPSSRNQCLASQPIQPQASLPPEQPSPLKEPQAPPLKKTQPPSPATSSGYQCQSFSPPSTARHFRASVLLQVSPPVKQLQASSARSESQASLPSRQSSPPKETEASPPKAPSPLKQSQDSSRVKHFASFPSTDQSEASSLLSPPLHHRLASSPSSQPYAQFSISGKQEMVVLELSSAQLSLPSIQGNRKKRPRSSAVRDFPEGCGKNLFAKANLASKQVRKEQKLGSGGEGLSHPRRSVLMMKDETALCLFKSQKMSTSLHKTAKAYVSLKWKQEAQSPMDLKKSKVRHLSGMLSSAEERLLQLEWHKDGESESLVMLPGGSGLKVRSLMCSNGSIPAGNQSQPLEGLDNLLPIEGNRGASARTLVKRTLQEFDCVRRSLAMAKDRHKRPDLAAAKILKSKGMWRNYGERKIVGDVAGVEVGDQFSFRIAMLIIGLHRQVQGGIDYISGNLRSKGPLATSIVASGGYEDDDDCGATIIYTGQGGNNHKGDRRQGSDQVLERGNLALMNSFKEKSPVRVIRGSTDDKLYTYDGLYDVVDCWFQTGASGFGVFQVKLFRRPGQPELGSSLVKFMGTAKKKGIAWPHLLLADISAGKERLPICVVNEVDDELAPQVFTYIRKMKYPSWCHPKLSRGCDCVGGCVDASKCLCAAKNGGEFPYNESGHIVRGKKVVFECGKSCACPSSCYNRLSQRGPTSKLEVFKTKGRGWGVRSWDSIRPGGFICEYVGELLSDSDAERRTGCDEYLFDIGNMMSWSNAAGLMNACQEKAIVPAVEDAGFTIDARLFGNVARFINHSCSPNLFAQNVVYESDDLRFPHVMLFSMENIPPMRELSYDYNYTIGHVRDPNGNVKSKACYCGAQDCRGLLTNLGSDGLARLTQSSVAHRLSKRRKSGKRHLMPCF